MTNHVDIDLSTLSHTRLSDPFVLLNFDLNEKINSDSPPSFLEQSSEVKVTLTDIGHIAAVLYWFELEHIGGPSYSTLDSVLPWKQAAIMVKYPHEIAQGQTLKMRVTLKNSCIGVKIID